MSNDSSPPITEAVHATARPATAVGPNPAAPATRRPWQASFSSTRHWRAAANRTISCFFSANTWQQLRTTAAHYAVYLLVRNVFCVIQILPLTGCDRLASAVAYLLQTVIRFRAPVIRENLAHALPGRSAEEYEQIAYEMWRHLVLMACEIALAPRLIHDTNWRRYFSIADRRQLVNALLDQRPVVLVAGHFGNFELGGFLCGVLGAPTYTVARTLDNPFLDRFVNDFRQRTGQFILPKDGSSDRVEAALAQGRNLTLLGDQYAGDKGIWVDFMGRPASCHKALALLTLRSGAPMVVVASRRTTGPLQFAVDFGGAADPHNLPEELQSVRGLTEWYNQRIAEQALGHPSQYWWVHKRWKPKNNRRTTPTQPTGGNTTGGNTTGGTTTGGTTTGGTTTARNTQASPTTNGATAANQPLRPFPATGSESKPAGGATAGPAPQLTAEHGERDIARVA